MWYIILRFKTYKNNMKLYFRFNLSEYRWKFTSKCYFLRNFKKFRISCSNIYFQKVIYEYFISIFSILNLCLLKHIINIQYPSEVISGLSHPQKKYFRKIQIFSEIANSDMVESASHPHPHTYGGAPSLVADPSKFSSILQVCKFQRKLKTIYLIHHFTINLRLGAPP